MDTQTFAGRRVARPLSTVPVSHTRPAARPRGVVRVIAPTGTDAQFLVDLAQEVQLRRSRLGRVWAGILRNASAARRLAMVIVLLAGGLLFTAVGTADQAQAIPFLGEYCADWRVEQNKDNAREGIVAYGDTTNEKGQIANTTWAQYGLAGINWDVFWVECGSFGTWLMGGISDLLFSLPMTLSGMVITFFQWTFEGHIINTFVESRTEDGTAPLNTIVDALQGQLFLQFFGLMTVIAALVLFWRAIIKGSGLADVLGKVVILVLVGAFGIYFGANAASTVKTFNDATNDVMGITFSAFAQATCEVTPGNKGKCGKNAAEGDKATATDVACVDSQTDDKGVPKTVMVSAVDCIGQVMYHALIFTPWATGELGPMIPTDSEQNEQITEAEFTSNYRHRMDLAIKILRWQAYSRSEVDLIESGKGAVDSRTGLITANGNDVKISKGNYIGTQNGKWDCYRGHPKEHAFELLMKDFSGGNERVRDRIFWRYEVKQDETDGVPDSNRGNVLFNACEIAHLGYEDGTWWKLGLDEGSTPAASWSDLFDEIEKKEQFKFFSGYNYMHRFQTAILALMSGLAMAVIILAIAIAYLLLQIATVAFAMLAPLACLIGLIPVYGVKIFLKWGELFLGTFLKRLGLGVFTGFLMTLYTVVLNLPFQWYMQVATLIGIALMGLVYRKKLMDLAGVGGVNNAMKTAGGAAAKGSWGATKGTAKFGRNRVDGARLRYARAKATYQGLEDKEDKRGHRVGRARRVLSAAWSGAGGGRRKESRQARGTAQRMGREGARRKARRAGYADRQR